MNTVLLIKRAPSTLKISYNDLDISARYQMKRLIDDFCHKKLTTFTYLRRTRRYVRDKEYFIHDPEKGQFTLPAPFFDQLIEYLVMQGVEYNVKDDFHNYDILPISYNIKEGWVPRDWQVKPIEYLSGRHTRCGLEMQTGCLTGDTLININRGGAGFTQRLDMAYEKFNQLSNNRANWDLDIPTNVRSFKDGVIGLHRINNIVYSGVKEVYLVTCENGRSIKGTADHKVMTDDGYVTIKDLVSKNVMIDTPRATSVKQKGVPKYTKVLSVKYIGEDKTFDICCDKPYHNFVANGIVVHNSGKTFCAINAISNMGMASMVVVRGLVGQWKEAFNEQTDLGDKAYCIQGFKSIKKLFEMDEKPSVFICSIDTMRSWQRRKKKYKTVPSYAEFLEMFGIGLKVVDEAHLCFHTSVMLDLTASVPHNIYLTATFDTADRMVQRIFRTVFSEQMKYGGMEYDKYTDSYCYSYAGNVPERACITPQGYSHAKYEEYMLKHRPILMDYLERLIIPIVNMHYINKKYDKKKLLIFCARVDMVEAVVNHIKFVYPHLNTLSYVHKDPDSNLEEGEIIVSTHKSCGTGTDIADLAAVSNMVSFQATTLAKQVFGRLRKPKDGSTPEYIDVMDLRIKAHIRHWRERGTIIKDCALTHKEFRL